MKRLIFLEDSFESEKTPEEICAILYSVTVPFKNRYFGEKSSEFYGKVNVSEFQIVSNIAYRNSFLPIIRGSIKEKGNGSKIDINMRMHFFISVFFMLWQSGVALVLLFGIIDMFVEGWVSGLPWICWPFVMIVFCQVMIGLCFFIPAKKSMKRLRELLG